MEKLDYRWLISVYTCPCLYIINMRGHISVYVWTVYLCLKVTAGSYEWRKNEQG